MRRDRGLPAGEVLVQGRVGGFDCRRGFRACVGRENLDVLDGRGGRVGVDVRVERQKRRLPAGCASAVVRSARPTSAPARSETVPSSVGTGDGTTSASEVRSTSAAQASASSAVSPAAARSTPRDGLRRRPSADRLRSTYGGDGSPSDGHEAMPERPGNPTMAPASASRSGPAVAGRDDRGVEVVGLAGRTGGQVAARAAMNSVSPGRGRGRSRG